MLLDSVQIGADDVERARAAFETVLGVTAAARAGGGWRFQLQHGAIEITKGAGGLRSLTFLGAPAGALDVHGITVHRSAATPPQPSPLAFPDAACAIDHVVVRTTDPGRAIATWQDVHGLRLALDREFPERRLRLQFFRSNHVTLEYASPLPLPDDRGGADGFFGLSLRVANLPERRARLLAAGVDVTEIRTGMRPDTIVASVRANTEGVPVLLLATTP